MKTLLLYWRFFRVACLLCAPLSAFSAHIIGGQITYECLGFSQNDPETNSRRYRFTFKIYRDCQAPGSNFDSTPGNFPASVTIFRSNQTNLPRTFYLPTPKVTKIQPDPGNACVQVPENVCVEEGIYTLEVDLPIEDVSYVITYQRCCRNNTITNITAPERSGATYTIELTSEAQKSCNNSPVFRFFPPVVLCVGNNFSFDHSGTDKEGDSLVYSLCGSLLGGGENTINPNSGNGVAPDPDLPPPYAQVNYLVPTYSAAQPLGTSANFRLDPATGQMTGAPQQLGQFVVGVCVSEYRNGKLLSQVLRDFQFNITRCDPSITAEIVRDTVNAEGVFLVQSCGNTSVTLTNRSYKRELITAYRWEFETSGGLLTSTEWDGKFSFPGPGVFPGRLILNPGTICSDTALVQVSIQPPLTAAFSFTGDTCRQGSFQFSDLSSSGGRPITGYRWIFGPNISPDTRQNPTFQFPSPGNQTVRLQVTTADGCSAESSAALSYYPLPEPFAIQSNLLSGCSPEAIRFTNTDFSGSGSGTILRWNFGDGTSTTGPNPIYTFRNPGTYQVSARLSAPNGCFRESSLPEIKIGTGVLANFSFSPEKPRGNDQKIEFQDLSSNAKSWQWDFSGLGQSVEANPTFTFPEPGNYLIRLIAASDDGCIDTITQNLQIAVSQLVFWPNAFSPDGDGINDTFGPLGGLIGAKDYRLAIYNRWGGLVFQSESAENSWNGRIFNNGQLVPQDVYFYRAVYTDEEGKSRIFEGSITLLR